METFYKNKKTADYFNGFCGERGSQTYGFLEYHKIRNSCMSAICKISQKLGYHRISFRIAIFGCRIGCRF